MNGGNERIYTGLVYDSEHFDNIGEMNIGSYSGDVYVVWDEEYARPGYQDLDMFTSDGFFLGPNWAD